MRTLLLATSLTAALGAATPAALAAPVEPAPITDVAPKTAAATVAPGNDVDADAARYADAEQANPKAAEFTGGASVVIFGSTATLLLALVLLILIV